MSGHAALAAANIKEYQIALTEEIWKLLHRERVAVGADSALTGDDYLKIKESLNSEQPAPKRKKVANAPKQYIDMSQDEKDEYDARDQRRRCLDAFRLAQGAAKRCADKVRQQYDAGMNAAHKLCVEKGFPEAMRDHYISGLQSLQSSGNALMHLWAENSKADLVSTAVCIITGWREKLEVETKLCEETLKAAKDTKLKQLTQMTK